jgi:protein-S-isoprenylcysteine O-methyltransferase Ste14
MFIAGFVVAGLDFRFGWSHVPTAVVVGASVLFVIAYALYAEVMRENAYLSRTVKVEEGQTVVDTGLYGIVRHPMYMVTILLFLMMPLILGSWYALLIFAFYPAIIIVRLRDEEDLLTRELPGYQAYKQKVKYRILPFIW